MDTDAAFDEIRTMISKGMGNEAIARVKDLAASDEDPIVRIKCLSLLKVIDGGEASQEILRSLMEKLPENESLLIQIAGSLRGLDYPSSAYTILKGMESTDPVLRLRCMCLEDMDEYSPSRTSRRSIASCCPRSSAPSASIPDPSITRSPSSTRCRAISTSAERTYRL